MGPALGVLYGPPKSLKSLLLILIGMHIAAKRPFGGKAVQGGAVVYVTSEGIHGVRRRLIAARRAFGVEGHRIPFALVPVMPNLGAGPEDRLSLERQIQQAVDRLRVPVAMIGIDTMRRAMPGKSENKAEDLSVYVNNVDPLAAKFQSLTMTVHHSPRSDEDRGSGSNVLDAAADVMIGVKRSDGTRTGTATVKTAKDFEEGTSWTFELRTEEIGLDRHGKPIVGAYAELTSDPALSGAAPAKIKKPSDAQQRVYDILVEAVIDRGVAGLAGDATPPTQRAITRDTLKQYCKKKGWWDSTDAKTEKRCRERLRARLNELAGKHAIGLTDEHVWLVARLP